MRRQEVPATVARSATTVARRFNYDFSFYYAGLDVHRKTISYCVQRADGTVVREGKIPATREALSEWAGGFDAPWCGALEATICSHWIYWHLKAFATDVQMGQPSKLKAISTAKRKNDTLDARTLADLLRCHLFRPATFRRVPAKHYAGNYGIAHCWCA